MSVRRKWGLIALALVGLVATAAVSVPYLVDVNAYKPALIEAVKDATGRELVIEGPLKLSFFPEPRISARKVHFANAVGGTGAQMLDVRWVAATPSWLALLQGRIEVGKLVLYQPSIVLETDADGVPNWEFKPGAGKDQAADAPAAGLHLAIGSVNIVQGTISYTYPKTGKTIQAEQVNATAAVTSFDGPFAISGNAILNGVPMSLDIKVSEAGTDGHDVVFGLHTPRGNLDFTGKASKIAPDTNLKGHLTIATDGLTEFIIGILRAMGETPPLIDTSVVGNFTFDGGIDIAPTRFALTDFKMSIGKETAAGTLVFEQGASPSVKGNVSLPKLKVDRWMALLATPGAFAPAAQPAAPATPAAATAPAAATGGAAKPGAQATPPAPAAKPPTPGTPPAAAAQPPAQATPPASAAKPPAQATPPAAAAQPPAQATPPASAAKPPAQATPPAAAAQSPAQAPPPAPAAKPPAQASPAAPPAKPGAQAAAPPAKPAAPASLSPFPPEVEVSVTLDAAEVVYRDGSILDVAVALEIHKGVITIPKLKATLPGDMVLQANTVVAAALPPPPAAKPPGNAATPAAAQAPANPVQTTGDFSLVGANFRETLTWLEIDVSSVPPDRLRKFELRSKLATTGNGVQLADLTVDLDDARATGSGGISFAVPLTATLVLQGDRFDLDSYLSPPAAAAPPPATAPSQTAVKPAAAASGTPAPATLPPAPPAPDKATPVFALKAKLAKLVFRQQTLNGIESDLAVKGGLLQVNALKVADMLGAKLDAKGSVADFGTTPHYDVTFNASAPDADKVIDYVGLPRFINGKIGPLSASGGMTGSGEVVVLRDATVTLLGSTGKATGTVALGDKPRFDFSGFALETADASRLLAAATGKAQAGIGAISAAGVFKGDVQRAAFDGNLTAVGTAMTGHLDATLGERPTITANLRVPGTLDFDHWLGVGSAPPGAAARSATGKPIDLSALRAFDANLTLETSGVAVASVEVDYADMQASLRNGVFKIAKLTGQFYGGAVDFSGTIDATRNTLALDLAGSLQGIYVGEMLRDTAGTNNFGNEHLTVTIDGKISIMGISLKGSGTSPEEIRNSLTGAGQVSGYLYPAVVKGSLGLASFATGVGSIFSTEMGFNSAVLGAFINHQNTLSGQLQVANGAVSLHDHSVQGQNAVAVITSTTSLTTAVTDTTIALGGTNRPADYVMTVKGPVSAPTMATGAAPRR